MYNVLLFVIYYACMTRILYNTHIYIYYIYVCMHISVQYTYIIYIYIWIKKVDMPISSFLFPHGLLPLTSLQALGQDEVHLSHVFFEKDTEPYARQRDAQVLRMAEVPSSEHVSVGFVKFLISSILLAWIDCIHSLL